MKTVLPFLLACVPMGLSAQHGFTIDAKKIAQSETPVTVVQAVATDFPGAEAQAYYVLSGEDIQSEWVINEEDNLKPGEKVDHYSVSLKGTKGGYIHAYYNAKGDLQMVKVMAVDFALPAAVRTYIGEHYDGFTVKSDKYVRVVDTRSKKEHMEVTVAKGGATRKLYFDKNGKFVKEK